MSNSFKIDVEELALLDVLLQRSLPELEKARDATIEDRSLSLEEFLVATARDPVDIAEGLLERVQAELQERE